MYKRFFFVLLCTIYAAVIVFSQEASFDTTIQVGFDFASFQIAETSNTWRTAESVFYGMSARSGNTLVIDVEIKSNFSGEALTADNVLKELSLSWSPASFSILSVGKQNLKWGTARVFSAIDTLTPPIDPLDPAGSDRGVTGIRTDFIPSWWFSFSALALPAPILGETRVALRLEMLLGETDLSFGSIRTVNTEGKEEPVFIADVAHFFANFGIYAETQVIKKANWEPSITGGLQIDIPVWLNGSITFLGEYRYIHDNLYVNHMYYFGLMGIPFSRKIDASLSILAAPEKEQVVLAASLEWDISQIMSANLKYEYLHDPQTGELGHHFLFTEYRNCFSFGISAFY